MEPSIHVDPSSLRELNIMFAKYAVWAGVTRRQALYKFGDTFTREFGKLLKPLAPAKGSVRTMGLSRLAGGAGIQVRPSAMRYATEHSAATAYDVKSRSGTRFMETNRKGAFKRAGRNWWQIAVGRELSIRESGRGYTAYGGRIRSIYRIGSFAGGVRKAAITHVGRVGQKLADVLVDTAKDSSDMRLIWGESARTEIGTALSQPKAHGKISPALNAATRDMMAYIDRKAREALFGKS